MFIDRSPPAWVFASVISSPTSVGKIHAAWTGPGATAAAGAENLSKAAGINRKLVLDALAEALVLASARIVSGGMKSKFRGLAGIPISAAHAPSVELSCSSTMSKQWQVGQTTGTGSAAVTAQRNRLPQRMIEVLGQPAGKLGGNLGQIGFHLLRASSCATAACGYGHSAGTSALPLPCSSASPLGVMTCAR